MDILKFIKNRNTTRKYKDIPVPKKIVKKVIEAGRWSSAVLGFQPWLFIVVSNQLLIRKTSNILISKSKSTKTGVNKLLSLTARTIANAPLLIFVYDKNVFKDASVKALKLKKRDIKIAELTEIQAISGAVQNMILSAHSLGIGACWNTIPLFCETEINELLECNEKLVAILTMGYSDEKSKRSKRKSIKNIVQYKY